MSDASLTSNQKSIVQRLRHLEKFEWIKNHDTYNAGLTTREGREILAEIERQWGVNVANHMHAKTITEDLFKARAEIERLRADAAVYDDMRRTISEQCTTIEQQQEALKALMGGSIRYVGYDCADCGMQIIEGRSVCRVSGNPHTPPKNGLGSKAAPADETTAEQASPETMLDNRINETRSYLRPKCPRCGADTIPFGGGGYVCVNRCDK